MAYGRTQWVNGTAPAINASNLNNIETWIDNADLQLTGYITPQVYGAVGDGSTDDTVALQSFVDAVLNGGLVGVIPTGTYKITDTLDFPTKSSWQILGMASNSVTIKQYTDNVPIFNLGSTAGTGLSSWADQRHHLRLCEQPAQHQHQR